MGGGRLWRGTATGWSGLVGLALASIIGLGAVGGAEAAATPPGPGVDQAPLAAVAAPGGKPRHVGYLTSWASQGRRAYGAKQVHATGAAARLSHLNYAFGNVSQQGRCLETDLAGQGDAWTDYGRPIGATASVDGVADRPGQELKGNFNQLRELKAKHPHLKVLMSLGGWTWSTWFSEAALTAASRRAFVASCVDLFIKGNLPRLASGEGGPGTGAGVFDGFDLDWEWPGSPGQAGNVIRPEDRRNFTLLLAEFRRQLDAYGRATGRRYELTAFLPAAPAAIDAGYEAERIFDHLDFATVQGYDFHGAWESRTNHQSALFAPAGPLGAGGTTADLAVSAWISRGAPAGKLVLGLPLYGRGWTGVPDVGNGLFQASTGPAPGTVARGIEDYRVLKAMRGPPAGDGPLGPAGGFQLHRDDRAGFAWLFDGSTFWTFDDPAVMRRKTAYIRSRGLGGAMVWSLDADDDGELVRVIHEGLR